MMSSNGIAQLTNFGNAVLQGYTLQFSQTASQPSISLRWAVSKPGKRPCRVAEQHLA
jgi:hypothetical protein